MFELDLDNPYYNELKNKIHIDDFIKEMYNNTNF